MREVARAVLLREQRRKKVPAIQAEQVEDDVAPVTAEYLPAKMSHEEYGLVNSKTSAHMKSQREKARRLGTRTHFTVESSSTSRTRWLGDGGRGGLY